MRAVEVAPCQFEHDTHHQGVEPGCVVLVVYTYLLFQGSTKIGSANYWNFATSPLVWSPKLKLAPRFNLNELGEISSEI